jgi:AcrR family transcriptional regulator
MELRERIIIEAGALFARYGIRSITMDSLAEEMGISKRTIYENFRDKDTLLLEVVSYFKINQLKEANRIIEESEHVVIALFELLNGMINNMKRVNPLFFHDMKRYHPQIFTQLQEKGDIRDHSITRTILDQGVKQGIFMPHFNLQIVNLALHELFSLFSPDSNLTQADYHREELFDNIIIPYLRGISTKKGMALIDQHRNIIQQHQNT